MVEPEITSLERKDCSLTGLKAMGSVDGDVPPIMIHPLLYGAETQQVGPSLQALQVIPPESSVTHAGTSRIWTLVNPCEAFRM